MNDRRPHPTQRLDDLVHQRTRLGILAVLAEAGHADFVFVRDTLELSDGNLSRNLTRLEDSGYVEIDKVIENRRPRTWLRVTPAGRTALRDELANLRELIAIVENGAKGRSAPLRPRTT